MPIRKLGKTVLLAVIVICVAYACVFFADYFFKTDFRIWVLGVKAFGPDKILVSLFPYLVFFLVFYVAHSVVTNGFNYVGIGKGKREWVNTAVLAAFNVLPIVILLLIQYIGFRSSGLPPISTATMQIVWTFPFVVLLPVATVISRKIYRVTNNPYLPGIIVGVIATLIACSNTLTWS